MSDSSNRDSYSVENFCSRHGISRAYLYLLWRRGEGPAYMQVGARRLVSREAAADWRRQMERRTAASVTRPKAACDDEQLRLSGADLTLFPTTRAGVPRPSHSSRPQPMEHTSRVAIPDQPRARLSQRCRTATPIEASRARLLANSGIAHQPACRACSTNSSSRDCLGMRLWRRTIGKRNSERGAQSNCQRRFPRRSDRFSSRYSSADRLLRRHLHKSPISIVR